MQEHLHTGPVMFLYVGASAWIFLNLMRLLAILAADRFPAIAHAIGGTLNFSAGSPA
jgi:hypothetical protein